MGASEISAGKAFLRLLIDDKEFAKGLDKGLAKLNDFSKSAIQIGAALGGVGAAITAPFAAALASFTQVGSALNDMSERTGLSVEKLSELQYAAGQTGTSLDSVERALRFMAKSGKDVNTFSQVAKQIAAIEDPSKRAQAAIKAFGKTGTELLPMAAQLDELNKRFQELGIVISTEQAQKADALGDAFDGLKAQFQAVAVAVGAALAPAVTGLVEALSNVLPTVIDFAKENSGLITAAAAVGVTLTAMGTALAFIGTVGFIATTSIKGLSAAMALLQRNPWAVVITLALVGLSAALSPLLDQWLGTADATDKATEATNKHATAQDATTEAIKKGNKELEKRNAALAQLGESEKFWAEQAERRRNGEEAAKPANDLRVQGIDEELRQTRLQIENLEGFQQEAEARKQRLERERTEQGSPRFHERVKEALANNAKEQAERQEEINRLLADEQRLQDRRDEITGDAAKKRAEEEKKAAEDVAKAREELEKKHDEQLKAAAEARAKHQQSLARTFDSVISQFNDYSRPTTSTFNGRLAPQIFGTSAAEGREERHLRLSQESLKELQEIKQALKRSGVLLVGAS